MIRPLLRFSTFSATILAFIVTARASTVSYCVSAPNSVGSGAHISWSGPVTIHGAHTGALEVRGCPANSLGMFLYGLQRDRRPFGDGFGCIGGPNWILARKFTSGSGAVSLNIHNEGEQEDIRWLNMHYFEGWDFQYFYRDINGPGGTGFNLTDGLEVHFES